MRNRNRSEAARSQRHNQPPAVKLNKRHSVIIRFGAMHDSVTIDGHTTDLSKREDESFKDVLQRRGRAASDLNSLVFTS